MARGATLGGLLVILVVLGFGLAFSGSADAQDRTDERIASLETQVADLTRRVDLIEAPPAAEPSPTSRPPVTRNETKFDGTGDAVTGDFRLPAGLIRFDASFGGSGNFIVWLYTLDGEPVDLLVNTIGSYRGEVAVSVPGGIYVLTVEADGPWAITVRW